MVAGSINDLPDYRSRDLPAGHSDDPQSMPPWSIDVGDGPVVATAIHSGHELRPDVAEWLAITEADRLREEDPLTGLWTGVGDSSIRVYRSRFEVDLNRPREKAIADGPEDCWGLTVWRERPPERVIERSLEQYDTFYREVGALMDALVDRGTVCSSLTFTVTTTAATARTSPATVS